MKVQSARNRRLTAVLCSAVFVALLLGCRSNVPHYVWPKKNINQRSVAGESASSVILIAAQKTGYKEQLVSVLIDELRPSVSRIEVAGLESLKKAEAADYDGFILINTCMAWKPDPRVAKFIDTHPDQQEMMIVYTTSGDGGWLPKLEERSWKIDALSGASEAKTINGKVEEIVSLLKARL